MHYQFTTVILIVKLKSSNGLPYVGLLKTRPVQCGRRLTADPIFLSCCGLADTE